MGKYVQSDTSNFIHLFIHSKRSDISKEASNNTSSKLLI